VFGAKIMREVGENAASVGWRRGEERYAAWLDVFQANTLVVRALEKRMKQELGLPLAGYEVLVRLAEVPGGERVQMQELARRVLLSKSGLSQLFSRLERRGLVERRGDPENLRVTYAILTEEGREALERARPAFGEEIEERFAGHLSDEEIRTVRRAMRNVIRASGEEPLSEGTND
jgi:DNA-binding MarR family transcriptional regulator